jgi:phosphatidylglycerol:prolipoprotein diacylglycerol transferase
VLALIAFAVTRKTHVVEGSRFRIFLASYLGWRLIIDFLKPQPLIAGMNLIQWSCTAGLLALLWDQLSTPRRALAEGTA